MNAKQIKSLARQYIQNETQDTRYFTLRGKLRVHLPESIDIQTDYDGNKIASFYLGSLINPSGKYYLPFACSNVLSCPHCKGSGNGKVVSCDLCHNTGKRYSQDYGKYPAIMANIRDSKITVYTDYNGIDWIPCTKCNGSGMLWDNCKYCGGLGSREAFEDSIFWEWLDYYADKCGGYIESGEGDPCDTFLSFTLETNED